MSRVLVTGGAGFIGFHLTRKLVSAGHQVDLLDNFSRGVNDSELKTLIENKQVKVKEANLLDPAVKLEGQYDYIYHLAAVIGVAHVLSRPYAVLTDNVLMLKNVLELAKNQSGLKRFIFASTSEVYAGSLQHMNLPFPTPESAPLALTDLKSPRTSYMLSKIYGEAMCQQSGVPFVIVRPHNFYGPRMGMSHVVPELFKKAGEAEEGEEIAVASVNHKRAFCYIDDAVEMMVRAAEKGDCAGETLNIGNQSSEVTIGELAQEIFDVAGKNLKIKDAGETHGSPSRRLPDMKKTAKLTGYEAQIGLSEGLKRTYDWYKTHIFSGKTLGAQ